MSKHRVPPVVQSAIQNVRQAMEEGRPGWNVSIRNAKVVITAPDGVALTIGMTPNSESLKQFTRESAAYNLIEGPVRTPAEAEALLQEAETQAQAEAEKANRQRQIFESEQAKKAAEKAAAATANGLKAPSVPATTATTMPEAKIPSQTTKSVGKTIFPAFDKALIGTTDYSKFQLPDGRFYCIECWSEGLEFTARAPQGLATHRGFRHQMYTGTAATTTTTTKETSRVILPGDVQDAIELLRSVVAENLGPVEDSGKIAELEAALAEVKKQASQDLSKADADYRALKSSSDEALNAAKEKIHQLTQELTGRDGRQEAETKALMQSFSELLTQVHKAINELSPVQAVGKIDELVKPYLKG